MFEPSSRYSGLETVRHTDPRGRTVAYKRRRFLPQGAELATLAELTVTAGDRLDNLAAQSLGDPEQFWQICDANNAMRPGALTEELGRRLKVPIPVPRA
jgi:hypothetical protein